MPKEIVPPKGFTPKNEPDWGTVWGTIVPKHDVFDPKKRLTGRAKLLISEQQAPGLSKFLNRRIASGLNVIRPEPMLSVEIACYKPTCG